MMIKKIDLNCDLGEGGGNDAELMKLISSCNIACGGHFGNRQSVEAAVELAVDRQVNIGAHPSYPDKKNFGRKSMPLPLQDLLQTLQEQIMLVKEAAEAASTHLKHVKAHGALYHDLIQNEEKAAAFVELVEQIDSRLSLFAPPHSILHQLEKSRLKTYVEVFADRAYDSSYNLLSRNEAKALLIHPKAVERQVLSMLNDAKIPLSNGHFIACSFDTICIHGDNPQAVEILQHLHQVLKQNHIQITAL